MAEVGWYYDNAGQQEGPVGQPALVELIRSGRIAPGTRVWRPGLSGWAAWETMLDLASQVVPPRAGPPPLDPPPAPQGWGPRPGAPGPGAPPLPADSYAADVLAGARSGEGALYPKAPLGGRMLAAVVDVLVTAPVALLWVFVVAAFAADSAGLGAALALAAVAASIWALVYSFTKDGRPGGQSIGKKMMGLMVVHLPSNQPCTRSQSALRYLVMFLLSLILGAGWLIELIVLLIVPGGRRLGDFAAGTQVIRLSDHQPRR
jgi:uncharacterized RDD family membrane protein YckC